MRVHVIMSAVLKGVLLTVTDIPTTCAVLVFRVKVNRLFGATKFTYGMKNEKHSGRTSKMTSSCKWPIVCLLYHISSAGLFTCLVSNK